MECEIHFLYNSILFGISLQAVTLIFSLLSWTVHCSLIIKVHFEECCSSKIFFFDTGWRYITCYWFLWWASKNMESRWWVFICSLIMYLYLIDLFCLSSKVMLFISPSNCCGSWLGNQIRCQMESKLLSSSIWSWLGNQLPYDQSLTSFVQFWPKITLANYLWRLG